MWWLLISMYVLLSVDGQYWENSSLMYWMTIPPLQDFTPSPVFNSTLLCLFSLLVGTGMAWTFGCISNRLLAIWVATKSFNWVGSRIVKILWKSSSKFTIKIKQIKLLFLLRKNRVYSRKYWYYYCYCYYYYYYYGYFTANWTHASYQATPCTLGCLAPFLKINNSKLILQNFTPLLLD